MTNLSKIPIAAVALLGGLGFTALMTGPDAAAVSPFPPVLTVHPNNVMVNTDTTVRGTHFQPGQTVSLFECSQIMWVVPQNPCDTDNTKTVTANGMGKFKTKMKVEACPEATQSPGLSQTCYIGVEKFGVDTVKLQPHAAIVVTFP
jgi:hypothetical protein